MRVALVGDSTLDYVRVHLEVALWRDGFRPELHVAPFGQYAQEILNARSGLHAFEPELVILDVRGETLFPSLYGAVGAAPDAPPPAEAMVMYRSQIRHLAEAVSGLVLVHDFVVPAHPGDGRAARWHEEGVVRTVEKQNAQLAEIAREHDNVLIFDMDRFASRIGKDRIRNRKLWHLGKVAVDEPFLPELANEYLRVLKPMKGRNRKCLVLDLDDTLWGGILGEAGPDGIQIAPDGPGAPYAEFQREVLNLFERGVILAVASKNNEADVLPVLRDHPFMLLRPEHFASLKIDWTDKVENLVKIAEEINIGVDSLVFLDDNPVERNNVRMRLPEVLVPELPGDPVEYAPFLAAMSDFDTLTVTTEDRSRGRMYAAEKQRRDSRQASVDLESYLKSLEIVAEIHPVRPGELPRVHQLMQKTNQFNTTTLRWGVAEIERFLEEEGGRIHIVRVRDRFGDSGLCGLCVSRTAGGEMDIVDLLLSCRVLGRGVEDALLRHVVQEGRERGVSKVRGRIEFTPRNVPVREVFGGNGFREVASSSAGTSWEAEIAGSGWDAPAWIRVESRDDEAVEGVK